VIAVAANLSLDELNRLDRETAVARLGNVYERAPWIAEAACAARPFATVSALYAAMRSAMRSAAPEAHRTLLDNHPDLAGKAARAGALTAESTGEQLSAGLDRLSDDEFAALHEFNRAYRAKFGFPFIICVRRHTKGSILVQFEKRLANPLDIEAAAALDEVDRIASLRLDALVTGPGPLAVSGRLSTHVLDTHAGRPASGVAVELRELSPGGSHRIVAQATTNEDGRTDAPLIAGRPVPAGRYELAFTIAAYFAVRGTPLADPPFLDIVPIRFAVAEPEANYHVPLLVTPWGYATYLGS
jgi:2-oxo-4-hydroxy-4-carboxy-5-ureidoimidazoline decarboxylase